MRSLTKRSLVVALFGLLVMAGVTAGIEWTPCPEVTDGSMICVRMVMTPQIPSLGETAEVIAGVNSQYVDIPKAEVYFGNPEGKQTGVELVGCPAKYTASLEKGVWKEFRFKIKFVGSPADVFVDVRALEVRRKDGSIEKTPPGSGWREGAGYGLVMHEKTKKFYMPTDLPKEDPDADMQKELGLPEGGYWYSIALHLRHDMVAFAKAKGIPFEEAVRLLKVRAERLAREKKMEKAKAYEEVLSKRLMWKEAGLPDPSTKPPDDKGQGFLKTPKGPEVLINTTVQGYCYYDDHKYNRIQGLLVSQGNDTLTPIRHCKIILSDFGSNRHPRSETWDDSTVTANSGNFVLTGDFPYPAEYYHIRIRLKAEGGPWATDIKFKVVDSTESVWYHDDLDTVWSGGVLAKNNFHPPRYSNPGNLQPISGAWNIFDCMYRAAYSKVGYPTQYLVKAKWKSNYHQPTGYWAAIKTISIDGDFTHTRPYYRADEWHDDAIFHEYGHFVYHDWTSYSPSYGNHDWWQSYPDPADTMRFIAFQEGWASFFSGVVRDSVPSTNLGNSWGTADSLLVLTNGKIGGGTDSLQYLDFEEPWSFKWFGVSSQDSFKAGPWCEGAVCGSLYDIMDRYRENPYPRHPLRPQWPDSLLADTMRIPVTAPYLSTPYFDVVKNYRINNHPVKTIYDFLSGWMHPPAHPGYSYGHVAEICSVLTHHRIPWNRPNAPTNLTATGSCVPLYVHLTWSSVSGALGYNVFRTPNYSKLNTNLVSGTSYNDYTVRYSTQYTYYVTSVDSLDNESNYSTGATIKTCNNPGKATQLGSAVSLIPTAFDLSQTEPNPMVGGAKIRYALPREVHTALKVYDLQGRLVRTLVDEDQRAAYHQVNWDLKSDAGVVLPAGVYFIRMEAGDFQKTRKLVVVR